MNENEKETRCLYQDIEEIDSFSISPILLWIHSWYLRSLVCLGDCVFDEVSGKMKKSQLAFTILHHFRPRQDKQDVWRGGECIMCSDLLCFFYDWHLNIRMLLVFNHRFLRSFYDVCVWLLSGECCMTHNTRKKG